jgi:metal-responsive CopG/Arc/MetJ family transcriptional regulator
MQAKTSITLSEEILALVDRRARAGRQSRSAFIERAVAAYLAALAREERNARDLEILNRRATRLNAEAEDVLEYQALP